MKYEVTNSLLRSDTKRFVLGDVVTPRDLTDAGFDVDFLLTNKAIEPLRGTETEADDAPATVLVPNAPRQPARIPAGKSSSSPSKAGSGI